MSLVNFIYEDRQYPIERKLLIKYSTYFSKKKSLQKTEIKNYFLINEFDSQRKYSEETIQAFLQYFKTGKIELNNDNIFSVKYLSTKYKVSDLINKADEYIDDNYEDLIENFLSVSENKEIEMYELENLLSYHMSEYISDDRLTSLPINVLYRLISYSPSKTRKSESKKKLKKPKPKLKEFNEMKPKVEDNQIVDFLIKVVKCRGVEATILFKAVKLSKEGIEYLIDKLRNEIENDENIDIDFNFIKKEVILYLSYKKDDDIKKASMEKENQSKMKDEFIKRFGEVEDEQESIINKIKSQISDLKNEIDIQNKDLRNENDTQNTDLRKKIDAQDTDLRNEIDTQNTDLRNKIKTQTTDLKNQMKAEFEEIKSTMMQEIEDLKREMKEMKSNMILEKEQMRKEMKSINDNYEKTMVEIKRKKKHRDKKDFGHYKYNI